MFYPSSRLATSIPLYINTLRYVQHNAQRYH